MSSSALIVMLTVTAVLMALLFVWLATRWRRETLTQIAQRAGGTVTKTPLGAATPITGTWEEFQYRIRYQSAAQNRPSSITVTLSLPPLPGWKIRRERALDRLGKSLGLAAEWQTGDERFDATYYLEADPADSLQRLLASPAVRQTVQEAFSLPWRVASLTLGKKGLSLLITPVARGKLAGFQPKEVLRPLASLARSITAQYPPGTSLLPAEEAQSARRGFLRRLALLYVLVGLGFVGGLVAMGIGFSRYEPLRSAFVWKSLQTTLPVLLLFLGGAFGLLRGRSTSHRHFFGLALLSLIVIPLAGIGTRATLNGALDHSAPQYRRVQVIDTYRQKSKDSVTYRVRFASWEEGHPVVSWTVARTLWERLFPGSPLVLVTHAGHYGAEWVERVQADAAFPEKPAR